jgi:hypothetical protein
MTDSESFADASTHFALLRSGSPITVDGYALGEPTGELRCEECGAEARNIDEIDHAEDCPQKDVHSRYWRETHD